MGPFRRRCEGGPKLHLTMEAREESLGAHRWGSTGHRLGGRACGWQKGEESQSHGGVGSVAALPRCSSARVIVRQSLGWSHNTTGYDFINSS